MQESGLANPNSTEPHLMGNETAIARGNAPGEVGYIPGGSTRTVRHGYGGGPSDGGAAELLKKMTRSGEISGRYAEDHLTVTQGDVDDYLAWLQDSVQFKSSFKMSELMPVSKDMYSEKKQLEVQRDYLKVKNNENLTDDEKTNHPATFAMKKMDFCVNTLKESKDLDISAEAFLTQAEKAQGVKLNLFELSKRAFADLENRNGEGIIKLKDPAHIEAAKEILTNTIKENSHMSLAREFNKEEIIALSRNMTIIGNLMGKQTMNDMKGIDFTKVDLQRLNPNKCQSYGALAKELMACSNTELQARMGNSLQGMSVEELRKNIEKQDRLNTEMNKKLRDKPSIFTKVGEWAKAQLENLASSGNLTNAATDFTIELFVAMPLKFLINGLDYLNKKRMEKIEDETDKYTNKSLNSHEKKELTADEALKHVNKVLGAPVMEKHGRENLIANQHNTARTSYAEEAKKSGKSLADKIDDIHTKLEETLSKVETYQKKRATTNRKNPPPGRPAPAMARNRTQEVLR